MEILTKSSRSKSSYDLIPRSLYEKDFKKIVKKALTPSAKKNNCKVLQKSLTKRTLIERIYAKSSFSNLLNSSNSPTKKGLKKSKSTSKSELSKSGIHNNRVNTPRERLKDFPVFKQTKLLKNLKPSPWPLVTPRPLEKKSAKNIKKKSLSELYKPFCYVAFRTKTGMMRNKPKSHNQDDFFIIQSYAQYNNQVLIGVMDGHGIYGHDVSSFIKRQLPVIIEANLPSQLLSHKNPLIDGDLLKKIEKSLKISYKLTQKSLISSKIDINYSGSTCITVLLREKSLVCANLGDSRAIIGRYTETWYPIELSHDHKPSNDLEKMRIENSGGRVEPFRESDGELVGPDRVWLKNEQLPGLAMSRSFGDLVAASVGVLSEPEIVSYDLDLQDKFLILASDGIWEFITNQECVNIAAEFYKKHEIEKACDSIVEIAIHKWNQEDDVVDDITIIVVFFTNS